MSLPGMQFRQKLALQYYSSVIFLQVTKKWWMRFKKQYLSRMHDIFCFIRGFFVLLGFVFKTVKYVEITCHTTISHLSCDGLF